MKCTRRGMLSLLIQQCGNFLWWPRRGPQKDGQMFKGSLTRDFRFQYCTVVEQRWPPWSPLCWCFSLSSDTDDCCRRALTHRTKCHLCRRNDDISSRRHIRKIKAELVFVDLFKEPKNRFPAWRAGTTTPFWRTVPTGYIGRRNRFIGIDSWVP